MTHGAWRTWAWAAGLVLVSGLHSGCVSPAKPKASSPPQVVPVVRVMRLPGAKSLLGMVARRSWARELQQIPAAVVDKGTLRHVPYLSYRAGRFEINVYGDPEDPACVEVGAYNASEADKRDIREVFLLALSFSEDQKTVQQLSLDMDKRERDGLTFEVTPPSAPDAYGGWWISVYDVRELEKSRASTEDLQRLTEPLPAPAMGLPMSGIMTPRLRSSGRVYARDYARKDGTYVPTHRRP